MATKSPDSDSFLSMFGSNLLLTTVNLLVTAVLYGVYVILFCVCIVILCRREGNNKARMGLLLVTTALFLMSSLSFWTDATIFMAGIQSILVDGVGQSLDSKYKAYAQRFRYVGAALEVIVPLEIVLGDTVVFWRAWALCAVHRKIAFIPLLLLIGTMACSLTYLGCYAMKDWPLIPPETCNLIKIPAYSLSMATNIAGTLVIAYNFWRSRQAVGKYLRTRSHQDRTEKVFVLLIESGVIYSILWIVQLTLVLVDPPPRTFAGQVVQQIFSAASIQLVGIYPTLLVILIYFQRSLWDASGRTTAFVATGDSSEIESNDTLVGNPMRYSPSVLLVIPGRSPFVSRYE
ncbi:hypothetical protein L218DRAFT_749315 [Marasmius fiardii PR-910]|nr:hypothetical protein L218DRAFT_749315 [Marasmius fiardii PR-910]